MLASAVIYCLTQRSRIIYPVYHPPPPPNYRTDLFHVRLLEMQRYTFALHSFRHRGACAPPPHSEFPLVNTIQEEHPTPRFQFISPSPPRVLRNCAMSAINCPLRYPKPLRRQRFFFRLLRYPTDYPPGLFHFLHDKLLTENRVPATKTRLFVLICLKLIVQNLCD